MEIVVRAVRKHQKDGLHQTLSEGIDMIYRRKFLNSLSKMVIKQSSVLTREELRSQAKHIDQYYQPSNYRETFVPKKKDVPSGTPMEDVETDDYGPSFVTIIDDTTLLGPAGIGRTLEGCLIADTVARPYHANGRLANGVSRSMKSFGPIRTWREIKKPGYVEPTKRFDVACPLIQMWGKNYYHWTAETLTKLRGVEHICELLDIDPTLLIPNDPTSWMLESLNLLGYDENDLVKFSDFVVEVDRLIVPSYPGPNASDLQWLRSQMVSGANEETPLINRSKRIFVDRQDATRRQITNVNEVIDLLRDRGFDIIDPGNYSVPEQVEIFSNADIIIGAHGAGLTNIAYSNNVNIVELFGQQKRSTFYRIAKLLNHNYTYIENKQSGVDIKVDTTKLRETVDEVIAGSC